MKKEITPRMGEKGPQTRAEFVESALAVIGEIPALIITSGSNMDYAIDESLARIGSLFSASRVYVMLDEKDGKYLRNTHEWVSSKIGPTMFSWPLYDYEYDLPSLKKIISENEVFFGHSRDMPQDLNHVLSKQGVLTFIVAPLHRDNKRTGLVGMDFCENECEYCHEFVEILHYLANLIGIALERKQFQLMRSKLVAIRETISPIDQFLEGHQEEVPAPQKTNKPTTLLDAERRIIIETLELYNGNKLKTAKHLGLTWPSLDRRCKKLGIEVRRR